MRFRLAAAALALIVPICRRGAERRQRRSRRASRSTRSPASPFPTSSSSRATAAGKSVVGLRRAAHRAGRGPAAGGDPDPRLGRHGRRTSDFWSRELNAMGISTFALDGFTGRGLASVNTDQALLGRLNMIVDAYRHARRARQAPAHRSVAHRADGLLARRPGGAVRGHEALAPALEQVRRRVRRLHSVLSGLHDVLPRGHRSRRNADPHLSRHAGRLQPGRAVQGVRRRACKAAGRDVQLTEYPNAQHGFDNALGSPTPTRGEECADRAPLQ